jgi:predicted nuclease of predicted toxin-antitoxin system
LKLTAFGVLADENVHPAVVDFLRRSGFDVTTVAEADLTGASDRQLLQRATREKRFVLTHDADFGRLAMAEREPMVGIVYLRPGHIDPAFTIESLRALLAKEPDVTSAFVVVLRRTARRVHVRIRKPT